MGYKEVKLVNAYQCEDLTRPMRNVLKAYAELVSEDNGYLITAETKTIAESTGYERRQVQRIDTELFVLGFLEPEGSQKGGIYKNGEGKTAHKRLVVDRLKDAPWRIAYDVTNPRHNTPLLFAFQKLRNAKLKDHAEILTALWVQRYGDVLPPDYARLKAMCVGIDSDGLCQLASAIWSGGRPDCDPYTWLELVMAEG